MCDAQAGTPGKILHPNAALETPGQGPGLTYFVKQALPI